MGTHPIFESDFDCLTVYFNRMAALFRAHALRNARILGFTEKCLEKTATDLALSPASVSVLTPADLSLELCKVLNQDTLDYVNGIEQEIDVEWLPSRHSPHNLSTNLTRALQFRFVALGPYREHWAQGMSEMLTNPKNYGKYLSELGTFSNDLLWDCGDQSINFTFHHRRLSLTSIILSSHAVFVQDDDEQMQITRRFIERQIAAGNFH